jgi:hypothetical protein
MPFRAVLLTLVLLAAVGAGALLLWPSGDAVAPPGTAPIETSRGTTSEQARETPRERVVVEAPRTDQDPGGEQAGAPEQPSAGPRVSPTTEPGVLLFAFDVSTARPIYGLRYIVERAATREDGSTERHFVRLPLADDERIDVRIEADGYEPKLVEAIARADGERIREIRVDLVPVQRGSAIAYRVLGPDSAPVTRVRLVAERRPLDAPRDRARETLWERETSRADGIYRLPDLEPGDYAFTLYAFATDGTPKPYQPAVATQRWTGSGYVDQVVQFESGCLVELEVFSPDGRPLGPDLSVRVVQGSPEEGTERTFDAVWASQVDGRWLRAIGTLPATAKARLEGALPAGSWRIEVRGPGSASASQELYLEAGQPTRSVRLHLNR